MRLDEFKAWFQGYTEEMKGAPTESQWQRIKEQVAKIDGIPMTYPVFVERYPQYPRFWQTTTGGIFNGSTALYAAGRAEALEIPR
jgi:hypothetical protein